MSQTIEYHDGAVTYLSDAGRQQLADEQRMDNAISVNTAVLIGTGAGLVVTFAITTRRAAVRQ